MVKSEEDVIKDFNEVVNMTADELEAFLKTEASETTGWTADGGDGESVGHQSGRKIVDILKRNPSKDASKYTDEDKEHMRKVVAYCKRHLAQEAHLKEEKTKDELEKTKSTRSLKNWGHDPLKSNATASGGKPKSSGKPTSKKSSGAAPAKDDKEDKKGEEKPKSSGKPTSKKAESKKEEKKEEEKPKSKGKPVSKKAESKKEEEKKEEGGEKTGEKREAPKAEKNEKPASKKAKTSEKPISEGTRKPPSRGVKKA